MHLRPLQENYIEKVLRDPTGKLARVTFCVYEQDGHMKARVVEVVYLGEAHIEREELLALAGNVLTRELERKTASHVHNVVSPYFDSNFLYTVGSQPRAPAIA